ncbi:hypothetical protein BH11BAC6_BH11BAC6_07950 [soil metagenome]
MKTLISLCFLLYCFPFLSRAQLCNGNLGDPIVNITFGVTGDSLPRGTTTFEYGGGCPAKGQYSIQSLIFGCGDTRETPWFLLAGDHARNEVDGKFMLVNAESTPGTIHLDTAKELCGNTTYQYSAWIANVMQKFSCGGNPVLPNIVFTVSSLSGVVLASTSTGDMPIQNSISWRQFGLSFTTPAGTDAVILKLTTNPPFGCGSAFMVDDITFSMCGPAVTATLDGKTDGGNVCADYTNPFILQGTYAPGFTDPVVQWQNSFDSSKTWSDIAGEKTLTYAIPHRLSGTIEYRMLVAERPNINSPHCRIVSNPIYTEIHPVPPHRAPQDFLGCINNTLQFPPPDPRALTVDWTGPNGFHSTDPLAVVPDVNYKDTGIYRLWQTYYFGCTTVDTFNLKVFPSTTINTQTLYSICEGNTINLSASGLGTFKWTPPTGLSNDAIPNPVVTPTDSIIYKVLVTNTFGCKDSADVVINVYRNPVANAGPDRTIVLGDTVLLQSFVKGTAVNYAWSPVSYMNNPQLTAPRVYPPSQTIYTLTAISTVGCGTSVSDVIVKVYKDIAIPKAFTPNGDGKNDQFKVYAADGYQILKFLVYDRWGKAVFAGRTSNDGWDGNWNGQQQPAGIYVYYLEMKTTIGKIISRKGTLVLLR